MLKGQFFIISGPSGSGKDTVLARVLQRHPEIQMSISAITRPMRQEDKNGKNKYNFVTKQQFQTMLERGELLEYNEYLGNFYGTPKAPVLEALEKGKDMVLEVDVNGAASVRRLMKDTISIFIMPPSLSVLQARLLGRGDGPQETERRMRVALKEIARAAEFDYIIVNDKLDVAAAELESIIISARARAARNQFIIEEVLKDAEPIHR